jgi:parallel beta-helix repeat protein
MHTMEASQRDYGIEIFGHSYINISELQAIDANMNGIDYTSSHQDGGTISGVVTTNNYVRGIHIYYSSNNTVTGSTVTLNGGGGIFLLVSPNTVVDKNTIHDNGELNSVSFSAGIKDSGSSNLTLQNNLIYSNGVAGKAFLRGIDLDDSGPGAIIRYNRIYANSGYGIELDAVSGETVYGNVVYGNGSFGITAFADWQSSMTDMKIYNNTVYGNKTGGIRLAGPTPTGGVKGAPGGCMNNAVINNISVNSIGGPNLIAFAGCENPGVNGSGNVYSFNDLGSASPNFILWGTDPVNGKLPYRSTYDAWEASQGNCGYAGCSHSVESDPSFTNVLTNDFTIAPDSPTIRAGMNLGQTYADDLGSTSSWPLDVLVENQLSQGGGWSLGAYTDAGLSASN